VTCLTVNVAVCVTAEEKQMDGCYIGLLQLNIYIASFTHPLRGALCTNLY